MGIAIYCSKPEKKEFLTLYTSKHHHQDRMPIIGKDGKKKYYVILAQVIRDTLQSITYYFAKYH